MHHVCKRKDWFQNFRKIEGETVNIDDESRETKICSTSDKKYWRYRIENLRRKQRR